MKKLITYIVGLTALALIVAAQESTNEPPVIPPPPPPLPPTLTFTNGLSYRVAVSDHVYRQLKTVWRLSGATNQVFSQWATNAIRIELSTDMAAFLSAETRTIALKVIGMGAGPNDDVDLVRIKASAQ